MSKLNGSFHRDASDRLTFDIYEIESERYPQLCETKGAAQLCRVACIPSHRSDWPGRPST
jgi:hypothetical protein